MGDGQVLTIGSTLTQYAVPNKWTGASYVISKLECNGETYRYEHTSETTWEITHGTGANQTSLVSFTGDDEFGGYAHARLQDLKEEQTSLGVVFQVRDNDYVYHKYADDGGDWALSKSFLLRPSASAVADPTVSEIKLSTLSLIEIKRQGQQDFDQYDILSNDQVLTTLVGVEPATYGLAYSLGVSGADPMLLPNEGHLGVGQQYGLADDGFNTLVTLLSVGNESYRFVKLSSGGFVLEKRGATLFEDFITLESRPKEYSECRLVDILEQPSVVAFLLAARGGYIFHRFELEQGQWIEKYAALAHNVDIETVDVDKAIKAIEIDDTDEFHTEDDQMQVIDTFLFAASVFKNGALDGSSEVWKNE